MNLVLLVLIAIAAMIMLIRNEVVRHLRSVADDVHACRDWLYPVFSLEQIRSFRREREAAGMSVERRSRQQSGNVTPLSEGEERQRLAEIIKEGIAIAAYEQALLANYRVVAGNMSPREAEAARAKIIYALRRELTEYERGGAFPGAQADFAEI